MYKRSRLKTQIFKTIIHNVVHIKINNNSKILHFLRNPFFLYICILHILNKSNPVPTHLTANTWYESRQEICGTISTIYIYFLLRKYISVRYSNSTFTSDYSRPFLLVANSRRRYLCKSLYNPYVSSHSPLFYPEGFFCPDSVIL